MHKRFAWWLQLFILANGYDQDFNILKTVWYGTFICEFLKQANSVPQTINISNCFRLLTTTIFDCLTSLVLVYGKPHEVSIIKQKKVDGKWLRFTPISTQLKPSL